MLIGLGGEPARIELFPGSGVDVGRFSPLPEPSEPITVGFVGRMLMYKGVATLVGAQQALAASGRPIRLLLAGARDTANPNSVDRHALDAWAKRPGVTWLDHVEDVRTVWARAHIAALASRSEGLPLSLLEAAACGRPGTDRRSRRCGRSDWLSGGAEGAWRGAQIGSRRGEA